MTIARNRRRMRASKPCKSSILDSTGFHRLPRYFGAMRLLAWHRARVVAFLGSAFSGAREISWGKGEQLPVAAVPDTDLPRLDIGRRIAKQARSPRPAGLIGLHLRSMLRQASDYQPTRPHGKGLGCANPASSSRGWLRLIVTSNGFHRGLSRPVIHPRPPHVARCAHFRFGSTRTVYPQSIG
jgi:hypothetical protein